MNLIVILAALQKINEQIKGEARTESEYEQLLKLFELERSTIDRELH